MVYQWKERGLHPFLTTGLLEKAWMALGTMDDKTQCL